MFRHRTLHITWLLTTYRIRLANYNSVLGLLWSLLSPLGMWAILYTIFNSHYGRDSGNYGLFLLIGIVCVNFFTAGTLDLIWTLRCERELFLNSNIAHEIIFASHLFNHTWKFVIDFLLCIFAALLLNTADLRSILLSIPIILFLVALTYSFGIILAVMQIFIGDTYHVWQLVARSMVFLTPVFFSLKDLSARVAFLVYWLNPLTPCVQVLRKLLIESSFDVLSYSHFLGLSVLLFLSSSSIYKMMKNSIILRI